VTLLLTRTTTWRMRIICGMLIWVLVGLIPASFRQHKERLRCTFLDVGHGLCILVENPEGQTLLVDVGSMDSALRASRAVQGCLWDRGYASLDTLAITHADLDHFNGTAELLKETNVGALMVPQSFVESVEDGAINVRETVAGLGIPITTVQRGQPLKFGSVSISVLHPGVSATNEFEDDNASSIVLLLEYAGKRVLLTGDVSGTGQRNLMSKTIEPVDVLLAPHHGSTSDNTAELDQWASPGVVVASSRSRSTKKLATVYPSSRLYTTGRDGAITCSVSSTGELSVSAFRDELPTWFQSPRTIGRFFESNEPD
ncbi:MAG: ComEC/Rec2 family competence protein, partial [Planctomycetaceae bacterium]